jgi:hypothetical protein
MDDDSLLKHVDLLINKVNSISQISAEGLKNTPFPDETIASLHNHLGNAKHVISNQTSAFNSTGQTMATKTAIKELDCATSDLLLLFQHNLVNILEFESLNRTSHETQAMLESSIDSADY